MQTIRIILAVNQWQEEWHHRWEVEWHLRWEEGLHHPWDNLTCMNNKDNNLSQCTANHLLWDNQICLINKQGSLLNLCMVNNLQWEVCQIWLVGWECLLNNQCTDSSLITQWEMLVCHPNNQCTVSHLNNQCMGSLKCKDNLRWECRLKACPNSSTIQANHLWEEVNSEDSHLKVITDKCCWNVIPR